MSVKQAVISILEENRGGTLSGQEIADSLNVSRAAVWKAVKSLQNEGFAITAVPNKGYILQEKSDVLSPEGVRLALPKQYKTLPISVFKILDSTNNQAKKAALEGASSGTLIIAEQQSAGRGRQGRSFYSPAAQGLYMSIILRPQNNNLSDCLLITVRAAVATARAISRLTDAQAQIKWVNDIFINDKKVCGILTEAISDFESGGVEAVIIGIGVNCQNSCFPADLQPIATSLKQYNINRNRLAAAITANLLSLQDYPDDLLIEEYKAKSNIIGKQITFEQNGQKLCGEAVNINLQGNLIVKCGRSLITLQAGEISIGSGNIIND